MAPKKKRLGYKQIQKINDETKMISIKFWCPVKKKNFEINWDQIFVSHADDPCDLCGSHGYVEMDVSCPCGMSHTVSLSKW